MGKERFNSKLKYVCSSFASNISTNLLTDNENEYPVFGAAGFIGNYKFKIMDTEYIGIVKDGAGVGRIDYYPPNSSLLGTMAYIVPNKDINLHWLKHCIDGLHLSEAIDKTTIPHIYFSEYGGKPIYLPSQQEQQRIADFLDSKCSEIDSLTKDIEHQIEVLEEYKKSVITKAVTKGLDPDVPVKDSGNKWLGKIPQSWNISRLGYESYIRARLGWKGLKADEYVDEGYAFISAFNIQNDLMVWEPLNFITKQRYDESPEIKLHIGDIVIVKDGAGVGKTARIDSLPVGPAAPNSSIGVITPHSRLDYRYCSYIFQSLFFKNYVIMLLNGMGVPHLTQEVLRNIPVIVPGQIEQKNIADYLDKKCLELNSIITDKKKQLNTLAEYKKSLIYEYVTGKKEVIA